MLTQEKQQRFLEAAKELFARTHPVKFELDMVHTVGLISHLQLAFRHPENTGPTSEVLKKFVIDLIEKIDPSRGDAYEFLMHGFNGAYDAVKCKNCEKMAAVIDGKCEYCEKPLSPFYEKGERTEELYQELISVE